MSVPYLAGTSGKDEIRTRRGDRLSLVATWGRAWFVRSCDYRGLTEPLIFFLVVSPVFKTGSPSSTSSCGCGMTWVATT